MNGSAETRQTSLNKRKKFLIIQNSKEIRSINSDRTLCFRARRINKLPMDNLGPRSHKKTSGKFDHTFETTNQRKADQSIQVRLQISMHIASERSSEITVSRSEAASKATSDDND